MKFWKLEETGITTILVFVWYKLKEDGAILGGWVLIVVLGNGGKA
jgi:hypothetical protein